MTKRKSAAPRPVAKNDLVKRDRASPALAVTELGAIAIKAGSSFRGAVFRKDTIIASPPGGYVAGGDYVVCVLRGQAVVSLHDIRVLGVKGGISPSMLGGFHVAPGGNASSAEGGDDIPAINPCSVWDRAFRPTCRELFGMTRVTLPCGASFWCDIYLTGADHLDLGTSVFGATIADGSAPPANPVGGRFKRFDYETATAVMKHHGKSLLSAEEFFAATLGVTERTAHAGDPVTTQLDAPRTSRFGLMQATGNMWVWGHDGHPTLPRASIFGGSWFNGSNAGSRCAGLDYWPENSRGNLGARGRCDHLQLA